MKKLMIILTLFVALAGFKRDTDTRTITGTVTDAGDGKTIVAVSINVSGTKIGTQTDVNGAYKINVPSNAKTLNFAFIGYKTQRVTIGSSNVINVKMVPSLNALNEVVAMGYQSQRRKDVTGSVAVIAPMEKSLSGRVAGLAISGSPGAASKMYIRGDNNYIAPAPIAENESYKSIAENKFTNSVNEPLSTFSVDVDAASYSNIRRFINSGQMPPEDAVRVEEMINYFKYDLAGPKDSEPVAIHTELSSAPWNPKHRLLRIGLKAKTIPTDNLPPSNLVFLIDVSGS